MRRSVLGKAGLTIATTKNASDKNDAAKSSTAKAPRKNDAAKSSTATVAKTIDISPKVAATAEPATPASAELANLHLGTPTAPKRTLSTSSNSTLSTPTQLTRTISASPIVGSEANNFSNYVERANRKIKDLETQGYKSFTIHPLNKYCPVVPAAPEFKTFNQLHPMAKMGSTFFVKDNLLYESKLQRLWEKEEDPPVFFKDTDKYVRVSTDATKQQFRFEGQNVSLSSTSYAYVLIAKETPPDKTPQLELRLRVLCGNAHFGLAHPYKESVVSAGEIHTHNGKLALISDKSGNFHEQLKNVDQQKIMETFFGTLATKDAFHRFNQKNDDVQNEALLDTKINERKTAIENELSPPSLSP
jgi:hypothetical protein